MSDPLPSRAFWPTPFLRASLGIHGLGAATLAAAPEHWPSVGIALLVNHLAISAAAVSPRSRLLGPNLVRLLGDPEGRVALTFDDGPDPVVTPRVLDLLDKHAARATFFCVGRRVEAHPELAREIVARGHALENHSYSHPHLFAFFGPGAIDRELRRGQEAIALATGRPPRLFRAPAGIRNPWLEPCLVRAGLSLVSWTRRGYDTVSRNTGAVLNRLTRGLSAGDILLLHDGNSARDSRDQPVVLATLPRLLDILASRGLTSVPLSSSRLRESPDDPAAGLPQRS